MDKTPESAGLKFISRYHYENTIRITFILVRNLVQFISLKNRSSHCYKTIFTITTQLAFTCSKSTIKVVEKIVKYVQS